MRAGDVEVDGRQGVGAPRDASPRITLGSKVLEVRAVVRLGNDDKVKERAVERIGLPEKLELPRIIWAEVGARRSSTRLARCGTLCAVDRRDRGAVA
jgi:hypothetical protein